MLADTIVLGVGLFGLLFASQAITAFAAVSHLLLGVFVAIDKVGWLTFRLIGLAFWSAVIVGGSHLAYSWGFGTPPWANSFFLLPVDSYSRATEALIVWWWLTEVARYAVVLGGLLHLLVAGIGFAYEYAEYLGKEESV